MKNLKRVLSLGLASVMLLGMMVVGASAKDFTDAEDIVNSEAVQVMVALGVINGKEDGSYFAPKDNVSRAEMAKMITVILMGGQDVKTGVKGTPTFTDIAGNWAEDYIEYCADLGIISGRGDGTFDPNGNVTVTEATKMALTAMGYNDKAYLLTGASWAGKTVETARTMQGTKLFDGLESGQATLNAPASRDVAAQILWNALQGWVVTYSPDRNTNSGEVSWKYEPQIGTSLLNQRYSATVSTGTFVGNDKYDPTGVNPAKGEIYVTSMPGGNSFPYDLSIDYIGEEVKVVWKDNQVKGTKNQLEKEDTIYGVFTTGTTKVIRSQLSKISDNKVKKAGLKIDGTVYATTDTVELVTNYGTAAKPVGLVGTTVTAISAVGTDPVNAYSLGVNSDLTATLKQYSGNKFKAVCNDEGKITTIYLVENYVDTVAAVNSTSVTLSTFGNLKFADYDIADGLKKGDVVVVTPLYVEGATPYTNKSTNTNTHFTVAKAEVVSGTLESIKENDTLVLSGKSYKFSYKNGQSGKNLGMLAAIPGMEDPVIGNGTAFDDDMLKDDFDLYLVNGYVVAAVQTSKNSNNYSVITEVKDSATSGSVFAALQLQVMGADGTKEIITVDKDSTAGYAAANYHVGDIVTYTFNDDDKADVRIRGAVNTSGSITYNDSAKTVNSAATVADCVLFVQTKSGVAYDAKFITNSEYDAFDIRTLDSFAKSGVAVSVATNASTGKVVAAFVNLGADPEGAETDRVYGLVKTKGALVGDGYRAFTIVSNDETIDIQVKSTTGIGERDIVTFKRNTTDKYAADRVLKLTTATATSDLPTGSAIEGGFVDNYNERDNTLTYYALNQVKSTDSNGLFEPITGATTKTYALDKDCVVVYMDVEAKTSSVSTINGYDKTSMNANMMAIIGGTGTATDPYVVKVLFVKSDLNRDTFGVAAGA